MHKQVFERAHEPPWRHDRRYNGCERNCAQSIIYARLSHICPLRKKVVTREVIITNAPSFLKYALGSRENVTLNGGAYIDGNIYAGKIYTSQTSLTIFTTQRFILCKHHSRRQAKKYIVR